MSDPPLLAAHEIHKSYGRRRVLRGASLEVGPGQLVAILGENGSGKSTLLRILAGADAMDRGRVRRTGALGYCPQDSVLYPYLTPDEHLELFACAYGVAAVAARARAAALADQFAFAQYRRQVVENLSGGTRQKLNLAIALLHEPPLLLLDEPYSAFDLETYHRFIAWADGAKRESKAIVVVTHLLLERGHFDAVYELREGALHVYGG